MNFLKMQNFLLEEIRNHTDVRVVNLKATLNAAMRVASNQKDRNILNKSVPITLSSGSSGPYFINDPEVDYIKRAIIYGEDRPSLEDMPFEVFQELYPDPDACAPGYPEVFSVSRITPIYTAATKIKVVSSSAADTTQTINIVGDVNTLGRTTESISLNGTTAVASSNTYSNLYAITKSAVTAGYITITNHASSATIGIIPIKADGGRYLEFYVHPIPNGSMTLSFWCRRMVYDMVNDADLPLDMWDPDFSDHIIAVAKSIILKDPTMLAAVDTSNKIKNVQQSLSLRRNDIGAYRTKLPLGRR